MDVEVVIFGTVCIFQVLVFNGICGGGGGGVGGKGGGVGGLFVGVGAVVTRGFTLEIGLSLTNNSRAKFLIFLSSGLCKGCGC